MSQNWELANEKGSLITDHNDLIIMLSCHYYVIMISYQQTFFMISIITHFPILRHCQAFIQHPSSSRSPSERIHAERVHSQRAHRAFVRGTHCLH